MLAFVGDDESQRDLGEEGFRSRLPEVGPGIKSDSVLPYFNRDRPEVVDPTILVGAS